MNVQFALVHATRGRPKTALKVYDDWMSKCANPSNVHYTFGVDEDDDGTKKALNERGLTFIEAPSDGCFGAYNRAASITPGDIVIPVEDDLWPCDQWDTELSAMAGDFAGDPAAIFINDGGNPEIAYFFTRALIAKWGHLYPPGYFGVFGDTELRDRINADPTIRRIKAPHLLFDQRHHSRGLAPHDLTYVRKEGHWEDDKRVYQQRKASGGW